MPNEIKDIEAPVGNLGDVMAKLNEETLPPAGIDRLGAIMALKMNQYNNIALDKNDVRRIARAFMDIEVGSSTNLVMRCSKKKCLYRTRCALYKADKAPEGRECLHENKILAHSLSRYIQSMDIDTENYPEMVMVNQLVEFELIEYRCNTILSFDHTDLKMTVVVGVDAEGQIVTKEDISYAVTLKEKVFKMKMEILKSLTATRQEKWKKQAALKLAQDGPSKLISGMKRDLRALKDKNVDPADVHDELSSLSDLDDMEI